MYQVHMVKESQKYTVRAKDHQLKATQKQDHALHHGARVLSPFAPGDRVWVHDHGAEVTVNQEVGSQSLK